MQNSEYSKFATPIQSKGRIFKEISSSLRQRQLLTGKVEIPGPINKIESLDVDNKDDFRLVELAKRI